MALDAQQQRGLAAINRAANQQSGLSTLERAYAIATAWVESKLRPGAVGDNGTSFGLYQHHIGGAGGTTKASAERYLNPDVSAKNRLRFFATKDIDTGAEAAALQRPADPAGYAAKVDAAAKQVIAGTLGGAGGASSTPTKGGAIKQVIGPLDGPSADHMDHVHVAGHSTTKNKKDPTREWVRQRAKAHGLTRSSGDRAYDTVAGSGVSDHYIGKRDTWADDYVGTMEQMRAFNTEMRRYVGQSPSINGLMAVGDWWDPRDWSLPDVPGPGDVKDAVTDSLEWIGENLTFVLLVFAAILIGGALAVGGTWRTFGGTAQGAATTIIPAARAAKKGGGK